MYEVNVTLTATACRTKKNRMNGMFPAEAGRAALAALALSGVAGAAAADCSAAQTTVAMRECAGREYEAADAELNTLYAQIKAGVPADIMVQVRDAQRAWIPYRDAACAAEAAPYEGGTIQPLIHVSCLTKLTRRRSDDLRALLSN